MNGVVLPVLRLICFQCDDMLAVPFRKLRNENHAHEFLREHGWIFGVEAVGDGVVAFDALCPVHGRETVARWIESGATISASARVRLEQMFPDLFDKAEGS